MKAGNFCWYDLMTTDTDAAAAFYRAVIGWQISDAGVGDQAYSVLSVGPANVGGLMPIPAEALALGAKPCWTGYILVDDVDACVVRIKAAGGALKRGPIDVPGVLRFAVVCDPHGAVFMVFKGMAPATAPVELGDDAIGNIGWRELHAGEWASDFAFYEKLFGWRKVQAIDMGALGTYQTFSGAAATPSSGAVDSATPAAAPQAIGGMMTKMADTPMPYWMYYINVDGIDAAADRVAKAGGQIMMAPHQVPTGQWIVVCTDPQGAWFSLLSSTK